ncbi:MAG: methyl-accepting chemotaxis protein [Humidesulfovibrio sp.]|nr:methyl-accepting chemotaxis protein [Humidesulfovibrio sp.]
MPRIKSLGTVLILSVTLIVALTILGIVFYVSKSSYNVSLHLQQQSMEQLSTATRLSLDKFTSSTETLVDSLAAQKALREAFEGDPKRAKERLREYITINKEYWALFLFDAQGVIIAGYNAKGEDLAGQSRADHDYVKSILGGQDNYFSKEIIKAKSGDGDIFIFSVARSIKSAEGKVLGGVGAFPKWETFTTAFIDPPRFGKRGYGFMLDAQGRLIAHAMDKALILKDMREHEFIRKALELKNGSLFYDWKGEQKILTVSTDPKTGWVLCMSAYVDEMTQAARTQRNILLGIGALAVLLLCGGIAFVVRKLVVTPVKDIQSFTEAITAGDFKAELDSDFHYEMAGMAHNIKGMVAEIKTKLGFSQGVLDGIPTPCGIVGPDFKMLWCNQQVCDFLERPKKPSAYVGMKSGEFYWSDPNRETMSDKAIRSNSPMKGKVVWSGASGKQKHVDVSTTPFYDLDGHLLGSISFWSDITVIMDNQAKIEKQNESIAQAAIAANAVSDQVASASEELAAQIEQSSKGSDEQRARTTEAATAMEEMNSTVMEVARSAGNAADLAEKAKHKAQQGSDLVDKVVSTISGVERQATILKDDMTELGKQAEGIGHVMNVISDIADQTNLLALNAAIEAARAGDAGRGFAVVADEVRKLAEKTMNATREVGEAIRGIQESARKNIHNTESTGLAVQASTELAHESGEALREIVGMVDQTADHVRGIATASEQQSAASEEISRSTEEINRIASETAEAMLQSGQAVGDLARLASELKGIINTMNHG